MASKNIKKRKQENEKYLRFISKFSKKAQAKLEREERVKKYSTFESYQELAEDGATVYHCYRYNEKGKKSLHKPTSNYCYFNHYEIRGDFITVCQNFGGNISISIDITA